MVQGRQLIVTAGVVLVAVAVGSIVFLDLSGLAHSPPETFVVSTTSAGPSEHPYNLTADDLAHLPAPALAAFDAALANGHASVEMTHAERRDTEVALHSKDAVDRGAGFHVQYRGTVITYGFETV